MTSSQCLSVCFLLNNYSVKHLATGKLWVEGVGHLEAAGAATVIGMESQTPVAKPRSIASLWLQKHKMHRRHAA